MKFAVAVRRLFRRQIPSHAKAEVMAYVEQEMFLGAVQGTVAEEWNYTVAKASDRPDLGFGSTEIKQAVQRMVDGYRWVLHAHEKVPCPEPCALSWLAHQLLWRSYFEWAVQLQFTVTGDPNPQAFRVPAAYQQELVSQRKATDKERRHLFLALGLSAAELVDMQKRAVERSRRQTDFSVPEPL